MVTGVGGKRMQNIRKTKANRVWHTGSSECGRGHIATGEGSKAYKNIGKTKANRVGHPTSSEGGRVHIATGAGGKSKQNRRNESKQGLKHLIQ